MWHRTFPRSKTTDKHRRTTTKFPVGPTAMSTTSLPRERKGDRYSTYVLVWADRSDPTIGANRCGVEATRSSIHRVLLAPVRVVLTRSLRRLAHGLLRAEAVGRLARGGRRVALRRAEARQSGRVREDRHVKGRLRRVLRPSFLGWAAPPTGCVACLPFPHVAPTERGGDKQQRVSTARGPTATPPPRPSRPC